MLTDCKLCVPVVTLPKDETNELLNNLKSGFKRIITWNKYLSQKSNQNVNNNLNFLVDPTFTNANRLFVLSFENAIDRTSNLRFYLPKVQVKDFNVIVDKTPFFDQPVKNEEEAYEKIIEITRNSEYNTGNLLDYEYFKKFYCLVAIDLSKQRELDEDKELRQQINFTEKLDVNATMFFIMEKKEETIIEFSQNFADVLYK